MSTHTLEKHRLFPYIAWFLIIGFSMFVFSIVLDLKQTTSSLEQTALNLEMKTKQNVHEIDFDTSR